MPQGLIFEVSHADDPFTPVWTDHTGDLIEWETKRGRQRQLGRMEAGTGRFILDNSRRGGAALAASRWDPNHPSLPIGGLEEWRPVRLRYDHGDGSTPRPLYYGYLDRLEPRGQRAELRAVDAFKFLAQVPVPSAWSATMQRLCNLGTCYEWWRLGERTGQIITDRRFGAVQIAGETGTTRAEAPAVVDDDDSAVTINGGYVALPSASLPANTKVTFVVSFRISPDVNQQAILSLCGSGAPGNYSVGLEVGIWGNAGPNPGALYVYAVGPSGSAQINWVGTSTTRFDDGENHQVVVSYDPSLPLGPDLKVALGENPSVASAAPVGTHPGAYLYTYATTILGNRQGGSLPATPATVDEYASFSEPAGTVNSLQLQLAEAAGASHYWGTGVNSAPRLRLSALLDLAGWPTGARDLTDTDASADWYITGTNVLFLADLYGPLSGGLLGALQDTLESVLGEGYVDRQGVVRLIGQANLAARSTIAATFGGAGLPFTAGDPARTRAYGGVVLTPEHISDRITYGASQFRTPINLGDTVATGKFLPRVYEQTSAVAGHVNAGIVAARLLAMVKDPHTYWPNLTVPAGALTSAQRLTLMELDLLDRVTVNAQPVAGGYTLAVDSRVVGIAHKGNREKWRTDIWTTPNV